MSPRIADLNETVRGVQRHFPLFINNDIKFQMKLTDRDLPVMIDAIHFEEVLLDLISNAVDAMPLGGTLTVTTECLKPGSNHTDRNGNGKSKGRALLTVADTGIGMTKKMMERVFDPLLYNQGGGERDGTRPLHRLWDCQAA